MRHQNSATRSMRRDSFFSRETFWDWQISMPGIIIMETQHVPIIFLVPTSSYEYTFFPSVTNILSERLFLEFCFRNMIFLSEFRVPKNFSLTLHLILVSDQISCRFSTDFPRIFCAIVSNGRIKTQRKSLSWRILIPIRYLGMASGLCAKQGSQTSLIWGQNQELVFNTSKFKRKIF